METELLELFEVAKKAADAAAADGASSSSPEVSRCVDALMQLKRFPISYNALIATQVGKRLRYLAKHPSQTIKTVASEVLEIWKKIIIDETSISKKNGSSTDSKQATKTEKVDHVKVEKSMKGGVVKVDKFSKAETTDKVYKSDGAKGVGVSGSSDKIKIEKKVNGAETVKVERIIKEEKQSSTVNKKPSLQAPAPPKLTVLVKCNDSIRDKVRELLAEALSKVASEADEDMREVVKLCDPLRVAVMVESVMYEKMGRSTGPQKFKYRSIMFNIKDANNPDLRRRVLLGEIQPERLISMTPDEMASDQRQLENSQIKEKAMFDCERAGAPKATTDQFKCGRCGQRKTTYYQLQTRSADEPMTTFVTCVNCNNHWKFC